MEQQHFTFGADTITNYWADGGFYINRWNVFTAKAGVVSKEPVSTTAINSQNMDAAGYHLYPNPAKNILYIETPISVSAAVRLYVRDIPEESVMIKPFQAILHKLISKTSARACIILVSIPAHKRSHKSL